MGKILDQMDAEENLKNDFYDEPTSYVSEAHEHFNKPGFVSVPPKPIAVFFSQFKISTFQSLIEKLNYSKNY